MSSFKAQFKTYGDPIFYDNAVRFATAEEAEAAGKDKYSKWTMAEEYRVVESEDPVNYKWENGDAWPIRSTRSAQGDINVTQNS